MSMTTLLRNRSNHPGKKSTGASAIEYAIIAGLIAVAIIGAATLLGEEIGNLFNFIQGELAGAQGSGDTPPGG